MLASAFAYGSMWWTFTPGSAALHLYLITAVGIGIFCNTLPMVINSMLADVCDADELQSGARREAFYGAVFVTCDKLAYAFALLLQGFLLNYSGFDAKLETQTPETVTSWMKWLVATQPTGFVLGVLCILAYPLTKDTPPRDPLRTRHPPRPLEMEVRMHTRTRRHGGPVSP